MRSNDCRGNGWPRDIHFWASGIFAVAALPLLHRFQLPFRVDWVGLGVTYWILLAGKAIFAATVLALIGFPSLTLKPLVGRLRRDKVRTLLLLGYVVTLLWILSWPSALVLAVDTVALLEVCERHKPRGLLWVSAVVLPPALYLFLGLVLVSAYNDIILSTRFFAAYDEIFNSADKFLLRGLSVSDLCHWALRTFPLSMIRFMEFIYYGMFAQIGAALLLISIYRGRRRGLQFVGAVLTAYYLALALFYLWPSQGPYFLCQQHFLLFPASLKTYAAQLGSVAGAQALWNHVPLSRISFDYYIAFPCMHLVQPLIVMWFVRSWKRIMIVLAAYDVLLIVAVVLLEWHYLVDIIAGFAVAGAAIAVVDGPELWRWRVEYESQ